jgi:hypothetical protein
MQLVAATFLACFAPSRIPAIFRIALTPVLSFEPNVGAESRSGKSFETAN